MRLRPLRLLAVLWASPYTAIGLAIGAVGLLTPGGRARLGPGIIEFHGGAVKWFVAHLPLGASTLAVTLGHTVLGQTAASLDRARAHELVHVRQFERWGPFMGPAYLLASLILWMRGRRPYRDNPFEREAYDATGAKTTTNSAAPPPRRADDHRDSSARLTEETIMPMTPPTPSFDLQPTTLRGELVALRPLRDDDDDFQALFAVASDRQIWEQHPESDRYREEVFRRFFRGGIESRGAFLALDAKTGAVIGSSRYHGFDAMKREIEIGWTFLARSHWGTGHNREMKDLMLRHAFASGAVDRVLFLIGPQNYRSQRAVEKIGATRSGTRITEDGRESVMYVIEKAPSG
ncbi:MAG: GNAT family N-acetyltransferase [Phycisphaerales bacterium]